MLKYISLLFTLLISGLIANSALEAAGLTTAFGEVILENLEIGKTYSTKEIAGLPLVITNTGDEPVDLKIELLSPQESELKEGALPIPDLNWIKLEYREFKNINPDTSATTDVMIAIPEDKQYAGRKFQVFLWSHTTGTKIGLGLKSKLIFTIK